MARAPIRRTDLNRGQIAELPFFSGLEPAELDEIVGMLDGLRCEAGQVIVTHEDTTRDVYFILDGIIRVDIYARSGRRITFELLERGQMFGELSAIDGLGRSAFCEADTDVLLARLSAKNFATLRRQIPDLAEASLLRLAGLVRYLCERLYEALTLPVPARIRRALLRMAEGHAGEANTVEVPGFPTDEDFAGWVGVGTTREAVNREIAALSKSGLLRRVARKLEFLDIGALRNVVDDDD